MSEQVYVVYDEMKREVIGGYRTKEAMYAAVYDFLTDDETGFCQSDWEAIADEEGYATVDDLLLAVRQGLEYDAMELTVHETALYS